MALNSGTRLGPFEIVTVLGAGGMGEAYRAKDTRLGRDVAIKILPASISADPVAKQRFEREAKTISTLNHPSICVLHDVGCHEGFDYLVMECVEGETLAARLQKGSLPCNEVLKIGIEIANALASAHRLGLVHRDLKPSNIMLTKAGAKLMDFGLAKPCVLNAVAPVGAPLFSGETLTSNQSPGSPITGVGAIVGTIHYLSPEQLEGKEADARSDIFALGAVLYEMTEVGDTIVVHFRNNTTQPYSLHPRGVFYERDSEGTPYPDTAMAAAGLVAPGESHSFVWNVPERAGPGDNDGSSIMDMVPIDVDGNLNFAGSGFAGANYSSATCRCLP